MDYYSIYIIVITLICLAIVIILYNIKELTITNELTIKKELKENFDISKDEKNEIYSYLKIILNCFTKSNIPFWIIGGTTLGSVRHGEMIPWDDDADIGVFEKDMEKVLSINKVINNFGYEIVPHWRIFKFRKIGQEYPFVDIFCYFEDNGTYYMNHIELRNMWKNEYYKYDELFPLKLYKFGNLNLPGPNYPVDYLDRMYPKWQYMAYITYDHKNMENKNEEIKLDSNNEEHKLKSYKIIKVNNNDKKKKLKKYNKLYNENILLFEEK